MIAGQEGREQGQGQQQGHTDVRMDSAALLPACTKYTPQRRGSCDLAQAGSGLCVWKHTYDTHSGFLPRHSVGSPMFHA